MTPEVNTASRPTGTPVPACRARRPVINDVAQIGVASHLTPGTVLYDQSGYNYGFANSSLQIGQVANSTASITMSAGTLSVTNTGGNAFVLGNANPSTGSVYQ